MINEHYEGDGEVVFRHACKLGCEGIVSKRRGSPYAVSPGRIQIEPKPTDCDFMRAPLGEKGCHYDETVTAYNAEGDVVGGDNAPRYSNDTKTGKPIISWDNGKTWEWLAADHVPDQTIKTLQVTWHKVTD